MLENYEIMDSKIMHYAFSSEIQVFGLLKPDMGHGQQTGADDSSYHKAHITNCIFSTSGFSCQATVPENFPT